MKKKLLCLFLLVAVAMNAQIVNIPDANFKNFLLNYQPAIDTNDDGEIQVAEAQAITSLSTQESYLSPYANMQGIEMFTNLTTLYTTGNVTAIDLEGLTALETLGINNTHLANINISGLVNLTNLSLSGLLITDLDLSEFQNLTTLGLGQMDYLDTVNVGAKPLLTEFSISSLKLTNLDLSNCPNLSNIWINLTNPADDIFVNVKNGSTVYYNPEWGTASAITTGNPYFTSSTMYICMDEGEESTFGLSAYVPENVIISTYCTFTPGGDHNTITGTVSLDLGNNGCDTSDTTIPFSWVQISDGNTITLTSSGDGDYRFDTTEAGTFTLTPQFENDYFTATPATVTFADNNNNTATQNFCVTANGVHNDAEVTIVPVLAARPGFDATYKIVYKNKGNQTLNGAVTLTYDDAVLDYVSASPVENSVATGILSWNYSSLLPFESREILLTLNVNSPMETPAVNNDDVLPFTVDITPNTGDETPADNTFALNQTVVGSYDPNDITCLEGATVHPDKIGDYLHYNINFENTGTYPASFVVVKDIIDQTKFDVSSLVVLNASHAVEARLTGNKIEFYFGDINLAANGGKGNVAFKIKSLETLAVNSSVMQKADIFFDYNWPIVTNEAVATYAILNNTGFTKDASVKIFPNPATNVVSISADSAIQSMQLFDVQGRLLEATSVIDISTTLDISSRANGIYFIKIATDKGVNVEKLVKE